MMILTIAVIMSLITDDFIPDLGIMLVKINVLVNGVGIAAVLIAEAKETLKIKASGLGILISRPLVSIGLTMAMSVLLYYISGFAGMMTFGYFLLINTIALLPAAALGVIIGINAKTQSAVSFPIATIVATFVILPIIVQDSRIWIATGPFLLFPWELAAGIRTTLVGGVFINSIWVILANLALLVVMCAVLYRKKGLRDSVNDSKGEINMAKSVKYGMVGGHIKAFIGDVHRKAINFDTRAELVAGCFSTSPQLNTATGEEYCVDPTRVYASYSEMAKAESSREDGIDFVSITVPNHIHYEVCKEFLEAGINVVCEKPLCFEVWQAEELLTLSKEKNLILAVTYSYTGYTMVKVMREMIQNGEIGEILTINGEFAQEWLLDQMDPEGESKELSTWRMDPKIAGISNSMGDLGTHVEHMVHYATGLKIKRLLATTDTFGHPLDFNAYVLMEYENGIKGTYWSSQLAAGKLNALLVRIYGTKGSLEWDQHYPDYLRFTPKNRPPQILSRGTGYLTGDAASYSRLPFGHPEGLFVGFANLYKNIISTVIKKKTGQIPTEQDLDFPTAEDGLSGVKFVHAVVESAKKDSAWVEL